MKNSTIKDIAHELKISTSTVSRALSDHRDIREETKRLVKLKANEINYKPNFIARNLKSRSTKTIGVIVPEIEHNFFSAALSGIEDVAYHSGYTIIVSRSNENVEREIINLNSLFANRVAGVIVSISQTTVDGSHFQKVMDENVPIVFFDRVIEDLDTCKIIINDKESAYKAVKHLIEKGYKRIAHFTGNTNLNISKYRLKGFKQALEEHNIDVNSDWIIEGGLHEVDGYNSFTKLLELSDRPEAIFAVNDPVAIGALKKIREVGLKVPDDIAIVGFSDNPICEIVVPSLTTIHQPAYEMGKKSAEILLQTITGKNKKCLNQTITLDTKLVVREST